MRTFTFDTFTDTAILTVFVRSHLGVSEAGEGKWQSHDAVWHVWRFPGHLRLGGPGAGGRGHSLTGDHQVQQHRDEPEQHQPHLHRLPDLPQCLEPCPLIHKINANNIIDLLGIFTAIKWNTSVLQWIAGLIKIGSILALLSYVFACFSPLTTISVYFKLLVCIFQNLPF